MSTLDRPEARAGSQQAPAGVDPAVPASAAAGSGGSSRRATLLLSRAAVGGITAAIVIFIAAGLLRPSWQPPALPLPAAGPPWQLGQIAAHISAKVIVVALWAGVVLAAGGVVAGLVVVRRGGRLPIRTLLFVALAGAAALVVVPPVGSTDALDYAVYGHIAGLGRSPYLTTPSQYRALVHLGDQVPWSWQADPSTYGPLATGEQFLAAKLGGASLARTVLWLKLVNLIAFAAVALAADRLLRADRAMRLRAHLLWTVNPLLLWSQLAAGHLDVIPAALGAAGLLVIDRRAVRAGLGWRGRAWMFAAGSCIGAAVDMKANYALFLLAAGLVLVPLGHRPVFANYSVFASHSVLASHSGAGHAGLRRAWHLLAVAAGAAAVLIPSYAVAGPAAIRAVTGRASTGYGWEFYRLVLPHLGVSLNDAVPLAACLMVPLTVLALIRLPAGLDGRPAIRAGVAIAMAWLLLWPHQYSWYQAILIAALLFYPASRLDWIAVVWLSTTTYADMPGLGHYSAGVMGRALDVVQYHTQDHFAPVVMLGALAAFVLPCVRGHWHQKRYAQVSGQVLADR